MLSLMRGRVVEIVLGICGALLLGLATGQMMGVPYMAAIGAAIGCMLMCAAGICVVTRMSEFSERDALHRMRTAADLWWCARGLEDSSARLAQVADSYAIIDQLLSFAVPEEIVQLASDSEFKFLRTYVRERAVHHGALSRDDPFFWLYNAVYRRLGLPCVHKGEEEQGIYYRKTFP